MSSTDEFLESARADLERQLAPGARVDAIVSDALETGVSIRARVVVGDERLILTGSGASVADAYEALIESAPPSVMAGADEG